MNQAAWVVFLYGLFTLAGGMIGYFKAKSKASLIAGTVSGVALLASAYGVRRGNLWASLASLLIALLLGGRFFGTWLKNRRFMPDLLMILFSLATLVAVGLTLVPR